MTTVHLPDWPWRAVRGLAQERGLRIWLVGGAVRDALLERPGMSFVPVHDWDFAVDQEAMRLARAVGDALGGAYFPLDAERGTARVVLTAEDDARLELDFALLRGPDLAADLAMRDFTVNAMALDEAGTLIDPLGGEADLAARLIRATSEQALRDDPVRLLRGARLEATLGFEIEPRTATWIRRGAPLLAHSAAERLRDELARGLAAPGASGFVRRLDDLTLLSYLMPELGPLKGVTQSFPHRLDVWRHTLTVMDVLERVVATVTGGPTRSPSPAHSPRPDTSAQSPRPDTSAQSPRLSPSAHSPRLSPSAHSPRPDPSAQSPRPDPAAHSPRPGGVDVPTAAWGDLTRRLGQFAGDVEAHLDVDVCAGRDRALLLKLAALLHDVGKPETRSVGEDGRIHFYNHEPVGARIAGRRLGELRFSRDEVLRVRAIVEAHLRPSHLARTENVTRRAIYRYFRDTRDAGVDVVLLSLADHLATWGPNLRERRWARRLEVAELLLHHYFERWEDTVAPELPVDGHDLMRELGLEPGPEIGRLLDTLREAMAAGEIETREEALALARLTTDEG